MTFGWRNRNQERQGDSVEGQIRNINNDLDQNDRDHAELAASADKEIEKLRKSVDAGFQKFDERMSAHDKLFIGILVATTSSAIGIALNIILTKQ